MLTAFFFFLFTNFYQCSCCDKYELKAFCSIGDCSFDEYSGRKGCGRLLLGTYKQLFGNTTFDFQRDIGTMLVVLFNIFQVILAGFSIYVYVEMSVQEKAQRQAIYKPKEWANDTSRSNPA